MPSMASNNDNALDSDDESVSSIGSVRICSTTSAGDVNESVVGPKADWKPAILRTPLTRPSLPGLPKRRQSSPRITKQSKLGCFGMTAYLLFMGGVGVGIGYFISMAAGWVDPWSKGAESAAQSSAQLAAVPAQIATNETSTPTYMPTLVTSTPTYMPTLVLTPAPTVAIADVATADPPTGAPTYVPTSAEPEIESVKEGPGGALEVTEFVEIESVKEGPGGALEVTEFVLDEGGIIYDPAEVAEDEPKRRRLRTGATRRQGH